jgi:hypothetical protein
MLEEFLHFIWTYQLFDHQELRSTQGEKIQVINPGVINTNSGPDFSNSRIRIDDFLWIGHVEIHVNASDWYLHQHQHDHAYTTVILHVVYNNDEEYDIEENKIPLLELKGRIDLHKYAEWEKLRKNTSWIPCEKMIPDIQKIHFHHMIQSSAIHRLERKVNEIVTQVDQNKGHWEFTLMQFITQAMGTHVNKDAFHALAMMLPFELIKKADGDLHFIEAILFGIAGFLQDEFLDDYPISLQEDFEFLRRKYRLANLNPSIWKFMRMRPINFPGIRLAQLATIFNNWQPVCNSIFYQYGLHDLETHLRTEINVYWKTHYRFDVRSKVGKTKMGFPMFNHILINAVVPFLYAYGNKHDDENFRNAGIYLLEETGAEKNSIISKWKALKIHAHNALESQGLIELKNNYCSHKKCLTCTVGVSIMNSK